jgi:peptidoglycan/LPS O-acetylase OafA/YrhL
MKAYRPDIDALRALAVSLVVIFHAFPLLLTGGYIGVDVFFVISGYLITKNIQGSLQDNSFSFLTFYQNRARRLLPVLYLVIAVTTFLGLFYLTPESYHSLAESGALSLVYFANTFFARKADYFGNDHAEHPFLHLWSLSVEEQFYFLWPVMLLVLIRYAPKLIMHLVIFITIVASIVLAEMKSGTDSGVYFLLQYRASELLLGAWLAICGLQANKNKPILNSLLTTIALLLIISSAVLLNKDSVFPGINVLWPCLGAVLYLYSAQHINKFFHRSLTLKPIITLGLLSYSIYLWHWPLLIYGKTSGIISGFMGYAAYFVILISISYLSWKYVEQAFRNKKYTSARTFFIKRLFPITITLAVLVSLPYETGMQKALWFSVWGENLKKYYQYASEKDSITAKACYENSSKEARPVDNGECKIGNTSAETQFLLIGDSHAKHFIHFFDFLAKEGNKSGLAITREACLPLINTPLYQNGKIDQKCLDKNQLWFNDQLKTKPDVVFLAAYWSGYLNNHSDENFISLNKTLNNDIHKKSDEILFYQGLENSISTILKAGATPVLVEQVPEFNYPIKKCVFGKTMSFSQPQECTIKEELNKIKHQRYLAAFDKIQQAYPEVKRLSINNLLCSNGVCSPFFNGHFVYSNRNHLNFLGSKEIAIQFNKQINSTKVTDW